MLDWQWYIANALVCFLNKWMVSARMWKQDSPTLASSLVQPEEEVLDGLDYLTKGLRQQSRVLMIPVSWAPECQEWQAPESSNQSRLPALPWAFTKVTYKDPYKLMESLWSLTGQEKSMKGIIIVNSNTMHWNTDRGGMRAVWNASTFSDVWSPFFSPSGTTKESIFLTQQ